MTFSLIFGDPDSAACPFGGRLLREKRLVKIPGASPAYGTFRPGTNGRGLSDCAVGESNSLKRKREEESHNHVKKRGRRTGEKRRWTWRRAWGEAFGPVKGQFFNPGGRK